MQKRATTVGETPMELQAFNVGSAERYHLLYEYDHDGQMQR